MTGEIVVDLGKLSTSWKTQKSSPTFLIYIMSFTLNPWVYTLDLLLASPLTLFYIIYMMQISLNNIRETTNYNTRQPTHP